jgi:uncharacterized delta-60 repeat protein
MVRLAALASLLAGFLAFASPGIAAPADLDPSFGNDGQVALQLNPECKTVCVGYAGSEARGLALLPDGELVVGGTVLVRLDPHGLLDPAFGNDGLATKASFGIGHVYADSRGRLLVLGTSEHGLLSFERYTPGGLLGSPFAAAGARWLARSSEVLGVTVDRSGRMLLLTWARADEIAVRRYLPSGAPDMGFGARGTRIIPIEQSNSPQVSFATEPDGGVVVAMLSRSSETPPERLLLARLTPSGDFDRSFGRRGILDLDSGGVGLEIPRAVLAL